MGEMPLTFSFKILNNVLKVTLVIKILKITKWPLVNKATESRLVVCCGGGEEHGCGLSSQGLHFLNCRRRVMPDAPLTGLSGLNGVVCVKGLAMITRGFLPSFLVCLLKIGTSSKLEHTIAGYWIFNKGS